MKFTPFAFCLLGLIAAVPAQAQNIDVEDIVAGHIEAIGGRAALDAVRTARITARLEVEGESASIVASAKRPSKFHFAFTAGDLKSVRAYDGRRGWATNPSGKAEYVSGEFLASLKDSDFSSAALSTYLDNYEIKGDTLEFVGFTEVDLIETFHLRLGRKNGDIIDLSIDTETFLVLLEEKRSGPGQPVIETAYASDYRSVDNIVLPFLIQQTSKNDPPITITITKVEFNVPLDDSLFSLPGSGG